jgi:hypothetical protein
MFKEAAENVEKEALEEVLAENQKIDVKMFTGKAGDEELKIAANALFKHKVDGEEVDVSMEDLLNNYSGKVAWDKKYTQLGQEKQAFQKERTEIEEYINGYWRLMNNDDLSNKDKFMRAVEYLGQYSGKNPLELRKEMRDAFMEIGQEWSQMSPEERAYKEKEEEADYYRNKESERSQYSEQQSYEQGLRDELVSLQEAHSISGDDLVQAYKEVEEAFEGQPDVEITPQMIVNHHLQVVAYQKAESVLNQIDESLYEDDGIAQEFAEIIMNNDFSDEDLIDIAKQGYASQLKGAKSVSKKLGHKAQKDEAPKPINERKKESFLDFDDL